MMQNEDVINAALSTNYGIICLCRLGNPFKKKLYPNYRKHISPPTPSGIQPNRLVLFSSAHYLFFSKICIDMFSAATTKK